MEPMINAEESGYNLISCREICSEAHQKVIGSSVVFTVAPCWRGGLNLVFYAFPFDHHFNNRLELSTPLIISNKLQK